MSKIPPSPVFDRLHRLFSERIAVLDGAMGTMVQESNPSEQDFRGDRFVDHPKDLRGNNDLLCLTRPDLIEKIHLAYFEAGADIVETNTFSGTRVAQADYGLESIVGDLNREAARLARRAAKAMEDQSPGRECFVAGALGPTNKTASLSPDVNNPGYRAITFDELVAVYREQAAALLDGGADLLLVETIFDTLNAKAAIYALEDCFRERGLRAPVILSATITDASGRTLSGQTIEAFWNSVSHARPFAVGLNCALGPKQMRPYVETLSRIAGCYVSCYPNAGLPNAFGGYDESPEQMAETLGEFAANGWLNLVGGCCGSTPSHIRAIAEASRNATPREIPTSIPALRLSGLEPLTIGESANGNPNDV